MIDYLQPRRAPSGFSCAVHSTTKKYIPFRRRATRVRFLALLSSMLQAAQASVLGQAENGRLGTEAVSPLLRRMSHGTYFDSVAALMAFGLVQTTEWVKRAAQCGGGISIPRASFHAPRDFSDCQCTGETPARNSSSVFVFFERCVCGSVPRYVMLTGDRVLLTHPVQQRAIDGIRCTSQGTGLQS